MFLFFGLEDSFCFEGLNFIVAVLNKRSEVHLDFNAGSVVQINTSRLAMCVAAPITRLIESPKTIISEHLERSARHACA
jgi:hypothetical protein